MARTKGSLNKKTIEKMSKYRGSNLQLLTFDKQIKNTAVTKDNNLYNIVNLGERNDFLYKILDLLNSSVTFRACVDFATNAIVGSGIDEDKMGGVELLPPNPNMDWFSFLRAIAYDFVWTDAFSFQIVKNRDDKTYSVYHQPVEQVRLEKMNEDGEIKNAYICRDWTNTVKYPPVKLPLFGFQNENEIPKGEVYLFYYRRYNNMSYYYGSPSYLSAIDCIQSEAAYQTYDLKQIKNGFTPSGILTLDEVETDDERNQIIRNLTSMFTGETNAGSVMISFRTNDDSKGAEFTPFSAADSHVDLYDAANDRTVNRIMAGFKIPSKALIGYPADSTGFSDSGAYLDAAFRLYNVNVADQNRREILGVINNVFKMNGVEIEIVLKPLKYTLEENENN